ncbi:hypothetical protein BJV82DRAFT_580504 [Fennellomyces sp. T-0311]|nr:hypothetical protein BJV82DRAFT_580504 [Fennellomyces sp. T-0311]
MVNYILPTEDPEPYNEEYLYWTLGGAGIKTSAGLNMDFDLTEKFILDTGATITYGLKNVTDLIIESITGIDAQELDDEGFEQYASDYGLISSNRTIEFTVVGLIASKPNKKKFTVVTDFKSSTGDPLTMFIPLHEMLIRYDADMPELTTFCMFGMVPAPAPAPAGVNIHYGQSILVDIAKTGLLKRYDGGKRGKLEKLS